MKCLFAYNPVSGKGKIKKKLDYIVGRLKEKYEVVDVYETKKSGDISFIARSAVGNYDVFVFSGGDGTFNEVITGLGENANLITLGYIPTGTVNDIARTMGIKRNIKKALNVIVSGQAKYYDVMKVNDRYSAYFVGCGAMMTVSYATKQDNKHKFGKMAYADYILKNDLKFNKFELDYSYDGGEVKTTTAVMVMIINSRSLSSFKVNKKADLHDGKVDVAIFMGKKRRNRFFETIVGIFRTAKFFLLGYRLNKKRKNMICFSCSNLEMVRNDEGDWNYDGEKGDKSKIKLEVKQNGMKLLVPKKIK